MPTDAFTFAIITDTHIRAPEGDLSSPFPVNEKANGRARYAVAVVMANNPDLTIHLGDMVHPLPHLPAYAAACYEAREILSPLMPALHFVPGNHDIGDKPAKALPAGPVTDESRRAFEAEFGAQHWVVEHRGIVFVSLNSSLINSGMAQEAEQKHWFEAALGEAKGRRIFVFSHYPPFIDTPDESEHYDNYAEPGRTWLLDLAADHGVEAIFSGHVHQFFFNTYRGVKLYCLPPTSFTRQDYSELYRTGPAAEFGRDDVGKFGITLIDVGPSGHTIRFAPTEGRVLAANRKADVAAVRSRQLPLVPHMRHGWFESSLLPFNGPMEEFSRKRARNDYPLLRLWQMGIDRIRTPLADLIDPVSRRRVVDFAAAGIRFSFFTLGMPDSAALASLRDHADLVAGLEIVTCDVGLADIGPDLGSLLSEISCPIILGKVTSSADEHEQAGQRTKGAFAHNVSYGFLWQDRAAVLAAAAGFVPDPARVRLCFQVNLDDDPRDRIAEMADFLDTTGYSLTAVLRAAHRNPAQANFDDALISERLLAALQTLRALPRVQLQCDTFEDIDRGYAPRHGLVDRLSNLRPVARRLIDG